MDSGLPGGQKQRVVVVAGCGYLGSELAKQFTSHGDRVIGLVKSLDSSSAPEGVELLACDLTERASLDAVAKRIGAKVDVVVHCASTRGGDAEAYHNLYSRGSDHLLAALCPRRFVFTSSTSVYGQTDGSEVDELSVTAPLRPTGDVLLEGEAMATAAGGIAVRLAGIYGPGRSVVLKRFFEGTATIDEGVERILNQIHRDDAAAAILHLVNHNASGVFNVADDSQITQRALYSLLSLHFNRPMPDEAPRSLGKRRGWTNKAVSNRKLRATGWQPHFPTFMNAVEYDAHFVPSILAQTGGN